MIRPLLLIVSVEKSRHLEKDLKFKMTLLLPIISVKAYVFFQTLTIIPPVVRSSFIISPMKGERELSSRNADT